MITRNTKPRLSEKAYLRFDRLSQRYLLLYPERGLELNHTANEIVNLCCGDMTVNSIVQHLSIRYGERTTDAIESEVMAFLKSLDVRGLLE